ncbi:MAG: PaaI family thioesterase [Planctomycetes bacterium]|nr:PaaI family thioesterase [Planctomycetota bacterium]
MARSPHALVRGRSGCFGCDRRVAGGLQLAFRPVAGGAPGEVIARCRLPRRFMGPPGCAHGGVIAALLDEAMAKVTAQLAVHALTSRLEVRFLAPVPLGAPLVVRGWPVRRRGRLLSQAAELLAADGTRLATATARFVQPRARTTDR